MKDVGEGQDMIDKEAMDVNEHKLDVGVSKDMIWAVRVYMHLSSEECKLLHPVSFRKLCNTNLVSWMLSRHTISFLSKSSTYHLVI